MKRLWFEPRLSTSAILGSWANFFPTESDTRALLKEFKSGSASEFLF